MVGKRARVFIRKALPEARFPYSLDKIAKKIKAEEFDRIKAAQLPEDFESLIHAE